MPQEISRGIWKVIGMSNCYILPEKKMLIDCGPEDEREHFLGEISQLIAPEEVTTLLLTHVHYDHAGNFALFPKAKIITGKVEIEDFEKDPAGAVLEPELAKRLKGKLHPLPKLMDFIIIPTPGHTRGSISLLFGDVLFSGDTLFEHGYGRTDLPTSAPEEMPRSLELLKRLHYKVLAPGHEY